MPARFHSSASSRRLAKLVLASLSAITVVALVAFTARAWRIKTNGAEKQAAAAAQPMLAAGTPLQGGQRARSRLHGRLTLQPEADRLRRQLGQRFLASGREMSTLIGTV
ncbi:MAG: hypothetical protein ACREBD_19395, partial [Blastocatellia bacterium]